MYFQLFFQAKSTQKNDELRKTNQAKSQETYELRETIKGYAEKATSLEDTIKALKEDKAKLVSRLQNADGALTSLSSKLSLSKSFPNLTTLSAKAKKSSGVFSQIQSKDILSQSTSINNSLDEILGILKQIPAPSITCQHTVEVNHLATELKKVNLELVNEKSNVCKLKKSVQDLQEALQTDGDMVEERDQKTVEIQKLRAKLQLQESNHKVRRQLSKEKKILQRKHSSIQQELKVVNTLYQTSATDVAQRDNHILELLAERKRLLTSTDSLLKETKDIRLKYQEKDKIAERYKRESCILLEKLNTATHEQDEMKRRNEALEDRLNRMVSSTDINEIKKSLADMQLDFNEIRAAKRQETSEIQGKLSGDLQSLYKKNDSLLQKITTLENQLFKEKQSVLEFEKVVKEKDGDIRELESLLDQQMSQAEMAASQSAMQQNMNESKLDAQMENLKLENEILQSRVLILEGISYELDILTVERDALKQENRRLKNNSIVTPINNNTGNNECTTSSLSGKAGVPKSEVNEELVLVNNLMLDEEHDEDSVDQLVKSTLRVEKLDDKVKEKLREMLSAPEFERFLSESDIVRVNLMESSSSCSTAFSANTTSGNCSNTSNNSNSSSKRKKKASLKNLSRQNSFENEHTINHMYQASSDTLMAPEGTASYEDVIQVYSPPSPTNQIPRPKSADINNNSSKCLDDEDTINYNNGTYDVITNDLTDRSSRSLGTEDYQPLKDPLGERFITYHS